MRSLKTFKKECVRRLALAQAVRKLNKYPRHPEARKHTLPAKLFVSLTSYPARFGSLHLTVKSLLDQTVKPDQIILWLDECARDTLPLAVKQLQGDLFSVQTCTDMRSFTKIVPALLRFPDAFIVTVDDDVYYPDHCLERLIKAFDPAEPTIVYHRGHRTRRSSDGSLAPYRTWDRRVDDRASLLPSIDVFPTGVGGVLYPPGSLPSATTNARLLTRLSPTCDDTWLYFMWRQTSWKAKRVPGPRPKLLEWPASQDQKSLKVFHRGGMKDQHLKDMSDFFGVP